MKVKVTAVVAKLLAVLLLSIGAVLIYYTVNTGWELGYVYPFFLFMSIAITVLGIIGLLFKLRG
ncbi:MAG: hypothetical protein ACUVQY_03620 [Thermoproteota archaeon]